MEGLGNKLSPLHFLMSVMVVLASKWLTLKFLQSSIVLTLSDSGINSEITGSVLLIIFYVENLDVGSWGVKNDV